MIELNETPVRTSKNFNINNIKLDNINIPEKVSSFKNMIISGIDTKLNIENNTSDIKVKYGVGKNFIEQIKKFANKKVKLVIDSKTNKEILINFKLNESNRELIDDIEIVANEGTKETIIIKYESESKTQGFHNGLIRVLAKKDANVNVILINLLNINSNNFMSLENNLEENAKINYTIIDFGGENSITNYYSNLIGKSSDNKINVIYLGKENQLFDLNYIGELRGEKSNIDIEVQGALKDNSKKHFKGTIDFKRGCKKATGNENESCMLLSDSAKSLALPMLLCSEEDVEGNHSSSAGKIGEKELFYIMSRGLEMKEAMKLIVRAKFNKILENIKNEDVKNQILKEIDQRLD